MADMVEKTGKTVEEALRSALLELGASEDQVSYEVLA
ncbi:MAG: Jag N-terminal domain-containing protein, partial [Selenomonadaceae bacterium]|nr:Jag N-terminal domain-containing protein [Selenomonadaceae bacterium]